MSKDTKGKGGVPETKVEKPTTIPLTKTQRELFITKRNQYNEDLKAMIELHNKPVTENLGKLVDTFIEELSINIIDENWSFDANTLLFRREKK